MPVTRTLVWLTTFDPASNGLSRRHIHFGPHLRAAGFHVHFLVPDWSYDPDGLRRYVDLGIIDSFSKFRGFRAIGWKAALSRMLMHPALRNFCRRGQQREFTEEFLRQIAEQKADVLLTDSRGHLFSIAALREHTRVVVDWCDSFGLMSWREIKHALRHGNIGKLPGWLYEFATATLDESYYPAFADANVVVSPADQRFIRAVSRVDNFHLLPNGIDTFLDPLTTVRVPDRIIFSGVMDFPPNVQSAIWFINEVLPRVRASRPAVQFILAGRSPAAELVQRSNEYIKLTGEVPDLAVEIAQAQLYVAPMICGSGFKNKVIEALASGTPVAGTPFAAEFLNDDLRKTILVADNAAALADVIIRALENPAALTPSVYRAQQILRRDYSWANCASVLASILAPSRNLQPPAMAEPEKC